LVVTLTERNRHVTVAKLAIYALLLFVTACLGDGQNTIILPPVSRPFRQAQLFATIWTARHLHPNHGMAASVTPHDFTRLFFVIHAATTFHGSGSFGRDIAIIHIISSAKTHQLANFVMAA